MASRFFESFGAVVVLTLATCHLAAAGGSEPNSPRIAALARELQSGTPGALTDFWKELHGKAPLVESIGGDPKQRRITFLWRATNETRRVTMMGGLPSMNFLKPLAR